MTDEPMPDWMVDDVDGCLSDVDLDPYDEIADEDVDDLVLTAGVDEADEAAKERRRQEYRELFDPPQHPAEVEDLGELP